MRYNTETFKCDNCGGEINSYPNEGLLMIGVKTHDWFQLSWNVGDVKHAKDLCSYKCLVAFCSRDTRLPEEDNNIFIEGEEDDIYDAVRRKQMDEKIEELNKQLQCVFDEKRRMDEANFSPPFHIKKQQCDFDEELKKFNEADFSPLADPNPDDYIDSPDKGIFSLRPRIKKQQKLLPDPPQSE